jgi:hypothetical protein
MRALVLTIGLAAALLALAGQANAQWKYAHDHGVSKVTQYKLNVPTRYRDAAVWIGPIGVGKPGLSEEARQRSGERTNTAGSDSRKPGCGGISTPAPGPDDNAGGERTPQPSPALRSPAATWAPYAGSR